MAKIRNETENTEQAYFGHSARTRNARWEQAAF